MLGSLMRPFGRGLVARATRPRPLLVRCLCTQKSEPAASKKDEPPASGDAAAPPPPPPPPSTDAITTAPPESSGRSGGLVLQEHEGENLPPLEFEPGVAGAAQKGVSAVVIAFGAAAFAGIAWGAYMALFPGATSTQCVRGEGRLDRRLPLVLPRWAA
jgi:hypothetical protein